MLTNSKLALSIAATLIVNLASAECTMKASSLSQVKETIEKIKDMQQMPRKLPDGNTKCQVSFKVYVREKWWPAEGEATGFGSADKICAEAINLAEVEVLREVVGTTLTFQEELTCTDARTPRMRKVKVGEIVQKEEVEPDPAWPKAMKLSDGNECLRFAEADLSGTDMKRTHGVICRIDEMAWKVVDKW